MGFTNEAVVSPEKNYSWRNLCLN